jgi:hypothetical protein
MPPFAGQEHSFRSRTVVMVGIDYAVAHGPYSPRVLLCLTEQEKIRKRTCMMSASLLGRGFDHY